MTDIQQAVTHLIAAFESYASKGGGDKNTMNKAAVKEMLQTEFGDVLGKVADREAVNCVFKGLDENEDNKVDFKEFTTMIAIVTMMCHEYFCE